MGFPNDIDSFPCRAGKLDCREISGCYGPFIDLGDQVVRNPTFSAVICDSSEPAMTIPDVFLPGQRKKLAFRPLDRIRVATSAPLVHFVFVNPSIRMETNVLISLLLFLRVTLAAPPGS